MILNIKQAAFLCLFLFSTALSAQEYAHSNAGTIHVTHAKARWCGNLGVSTKVGNKNTNGNCVYVKETPPNGFDTCGPFNLHGYRLEQIVGTGFNCAATHVHSNVFGEDGLDEYTLISDKDGHYIYTEPYENTIILH